MYNTDINFFFLPLFILLILPLVKPFLSRVEATKNVKIFALGPIDNRNVLLFCLHSIFKHKCNLFFRVD